MTPLPPGRSPGSGFRIRPSARSGCPRHQLAVLSLYSGASIRRFPHVVKLLWCAASVWTVEHTGTRHGMPLLQYLKVSFLTIVEGASHAPVVKHRALLSWKGHPVPRRRPHIRVGVGQWAPRSCFAPNPNAHWCASSTLFSRSWQAGPAKAAQGRSGSLVHSRMCRGPAHYLQRGELNCPIAAFVLRFWTLWRKLLQRARSHPCAIGRNMTLLLLAICASI